MVARLMLITRGKERRKQKKKKAPVNTIAFDYFSVYHFASLAISIRDPFLPCFFIFYLLTSLPFNLILPTVLLILYVTLLIVARHSTRTSGTDACTYEYYANSSSEIFRKCTLLQLLR